jgi:paraquat-inducible protein A
MADFQTAAELGLVACPACHLVCRPAPGSAESGCPRCHAQLHPRKPDSIARTWALLLAGYALYVPANILPVTETRSLFESQIDTILSGVAYLWSSGSWFLAMVVFAASIMVPLAKLVSLTVLAISVQRRWAWRPLQRSRVYRLIDFIGRWSMLDIYVITLLVGLVQIQTFANIKAGPGVLAFGALVVVTLFATLSFDSRLIWDAARDTVRDADG